MRHAQAKILAALGASVPDLKTLYPNFPDTQLQVALDWGRRDEDTLQYCNPSDSTNWTNTTILVASNKRIYRTRPTGVAVSGFIPVPLRTAPPTGTTVWRLSMSPGEDDPARFEWTDMPWHRKWLKHGWVFANEHDAAACMKVLAQMLLEEPP